MTERKPGLVFLRRILAPKEIRPPIIDSDLEKLNGLERATEVLRYMILALEWWLSPNGRLREWLRLNGSISAVLLIPAVLVAPLVTLILWQFFTWTVFLNQILWNIVIGAAVLGCMALLIKGISR